MQPTYGNWKIIREIGRGSFGVVYEIAREEYGYTYHAALKVITIPQERSEIDQIRSQGLSDADVTEYYKGIVEDCVREIAMMSKMQGHTNIVNYQNHEVQPHADGLGWDILIQMELLTSLSKYTASHAMTLRDVVNVGIGVCHALERCQKLHIIHRDIKPDNIFVSDQGDFKLGDFGIARTAERTMSGMSRKGTYTYMAPEIYSGKAYSDSVDLYSLGLVLYRLLNNNRGPFMPPYPDKIQYKDQEQALIRRMRGEPLPMPGQNQGRLAEIVLKACSFDPKDRYASPKEMREELEELLKSGDARKETVVNEKTKPSDDQLTDTETEVLPTEKTEEEKTIFLWGKRQEKEEPETEEEEDMPEEELHEEETVSLEDPPKRALSKKWIALIACLVVLLIGGGCFGVYWSTTDPVPDVINLSVKEAKQVFQDNGFELEEGEQIPSEEVAKGKIAAQEKEGRRAKPGAVLAVSVSLGKQTTLEDYTGKSVDEVEKALQERGITVKKKMEYHAGHASGEILEQSSAEGAKLREGNTLVLTVSSDQKPIKLDSYIGMAKNDAVEKAEKLKLKVKIERAFDTSVQKGKVSAQKPKKGERVKEGDTITLTISKGVEQVEVPYLLGKSRAEAESALKAAGLNVGSVTTSYSTYAYGKVCGQSNMAGVLVDKGSSIGLTVSIGQKPTYTPPANNKPKQSVDDTPKADADAEDFGL